MAIPRGSNENPIRIPEVEKGDLENDPIIVEDYDWDNSYLDVESVNEDSSDEDTCSESFGLEYQRQPGVGVRSDQSGCSGSTIDIEAEPDNGSIRSYSQGLPVDLGSGRRRKKAQISVEGSFWPAQEGINKLMAMQHSGKATPMRILPNFTATEIGGQDICEGILSQSRRQGLQCLHSSDQNNSCKAPMFDEADTKRARKKRELSESPFIVPVDEEDLWVDPSARNHHVVDNQMTEDEFSTMDYIQGDGMTSHPFDTALPLDSYIGDVTLEKHASIEPEFVELRRYIIKRELRHWDELKINGKACAEEMMKKLGAHLPEGSRNGKF